MKTCLYEYAVHKDSWTDSKYTNSIGHQENKAYEDNLSFANLKENKHGVRLFKRNAYLIFFLFVYQ